MTTQKERKYRSAVAEAKNLLATLEKAKMRIAQLAYENCEVILGGHAVGDRYSLSMFASDIGVNRKTLSDWVHNYEIKLRIEEESKKNKNLKKVLADGSDSPKTQKQLNEIRKILRSKKGGLKKNITPAKVAEAAQQLINFTEEDRNIAFYKKQIMTLEYALCHEGLDLTQIDQDDLAYIEGFAKNIIKKLGNHFKVYERPSVNLRKVTDLTGHRVAAKTKQEMRLSH